jgi:hypothetical protein
MILLGNLYEIKNGVVQWNGYPIPRADPATFQHLGGSWGRDARHVFVHNNVKKIDLATFQYLNPVFVKDANNAYDWEGTIKGADAKTFEVLDPGIRVDEKLTTAVWACGFARDCNAVYFHDQMTGRASAVRGADPATFVSLRNGYGIDSKSVWGGDLRLPKADPKTWLYLGRGWSMDCERVYCGGSEAPGIDRERFTVVAAPTIALYATDCKRFFENHRPIEEQEFWQKLSENFSSFEKWFRVAYEKIRNTCTTCGGSGDCVCKRKGHTDTSSCTHCSGSGKCRVCDGAGHKQPRRHI